MKKIKISIVCITYNHARFIRDCIDGFLMQQTNFPFEILVHDDASTDGTTEILREYSNKYPNIIPFYEKNNQFQKFDFLKYSLFPMIKGEYVAFCEGDDYWTDPLKLQKQADYLDAHPDCSMCFHPVVVHWETGSEPDCLFPVPAQRFNKTVLTFKELLKRNFIQTNAVVYRWRFHQDSLNLLPDNILPGDWFLHLLHAQTGKIGYIEDAMGVYRRHDGGVWIGAWHSVEWFRKCGVPTLHFFETLKESFQAKAPKEKDVLLLACYACAKKTSDENWLNQLEKFGKPSRYLLALLWMKYLCCRVLEPVTRGALKKKIQSSRVFFEKVFCKL